MKIVFTVNLAIQYSLILNQQDIKNRLLSFVHFNEGGKQAQLPYYAEHGHFEPSDRSKYRDGLEALNAETLGNTQENQDDDTQPRRTPQKRQPRQGGFVDNVVHPGLDTPSLRRR